MILGWLFAKKLTTCVEYKYSSNNVNKALLGGKFMIWMLEKYVLGPVWFQYPSKGGELVSET